MYTNSLFISVPIIQSTTLFQQQQQQNNYKSCQRKAMWGMQRIYTVWRDKASIKVRLRYDTDVGITRQGT